MNKHMFGSHAMIDIETLDTDSKGSVILSICIVKFDPFTVQTIDEISKLPKIYRELDPMTEIKLGGSVSESTLKFWVESDTEWLRRLFCGSLQSNDISVAELNKWIRTELADCNNYWGNGSDFDNIQVDKLFTRYKIESPLEFFRRSCYRTVTKMCPDSELERPSQLVKHQAYDDCIYQILRIQKCFSILGLKNDEVKVERVQLNESTVSVISEPSLVKQAVS